MSDSEVSDLEKLVREIKKDGENTNEEKVEKGKEGKQG